MVRAGPHVSEDQRPEVNDGQAVRVNRPLGLLGDEVINNAQKTCREEKAHRVMAVPPLHHRVLHAGVDRVRLHQAGRHDRRIDDVQHGHRDDECAEKPVGHINVPHLANADGAEEHHRIGHPGDGDQNGDRPLQLGVFLTAGKAQRQRDRSRQNDQLPAPEVKCGQLV